MHVGLRVSDLERSIAFYTTVGYAVVGLVPETGLGHLTMLKLPGDDVELVHTPTMGDVDLGTGFSHRVIPVGAVGSTVDRLAAAGIEAEAPVAPDGSEDFRTTWLTDPAGRRIELVQWPDGHADGLTAADWAT